MRPAPALALLLSVLASHGAAVEAPAASAGLRGVHLTGWGAGNAAKRREYIAKMTDGGFNAAVIALKDYDGHVFVRGTKLGEETRAYVNAVPDLHGLVRDFKNAGHYVIARIAVFKDDHLARARPDLAVKFPDGSIWTNDKGTAWVDPYQEEVWDYVIDIGSRAAAAGFDEVQYDFIRFPSDGKTRQCRYKREDHSPRTAAAALSAFLERAAARLKPLGVKTSICAFGLTTSVDSGLGIGQKLGEMAAKMDYVSPMMYPSHYARGEYGLASPNRHPYITVRRGVEDALGRLPGRPESLRPYLQDFSLGVRYDAAKVRAQIRAAEELGVKGWILWNAQNKYTWDAAKAGPIHMTEVPTTPPAPFPRPRKLKTPDPAVIKTAAPSPETP